MKHKAFNGISPELGRKTYFEEHIFFFWKKAFLYLALVSQTPSLWLTLPTMEELSENYLIPVNEKIRHPPAEPSSHGAVCGQKSAGCEGTSQLYKHMAHIPKANCPPHLPPLLNLPCNLLGGPMKRWLQRHRFCSLVSDGSAKCKCAGPTGKGLLCYYSCIYHRWSWGEEKEVFPEQITE